MHVVSPVCGGLDVHQAQRTACLRCVSPEGQITLERREFGTTYGELLARSDWLAAHACPVVALESTGVYWRPVYHVLVGTVEVLVGHARDIRPRPGTKTDKADATWIAELLAHGLIRPSFVPPPTISALRDLTQTRVALVQTRTQAKNRVHTVLEETNITRSSVVTDLCGNSGRQMRAALIAGERDPQRLSALALGRLRRKLPQLALALVGQCTVHHGRLIQGALDLIALLEQQIADLDQQLGELVAPLQPQLAQLDSIPGVDLLAARAMIAEIGVDMSRFGAAGRFAAWARVAPGNNESAGKRRNGRTGKGNRYLRRILVQCAWAARKTPTFLGRTFRRLEGRLGKKKAAVAIAQKILVLVYHLLAEGTYYDEQRSAHLHPQQEDRWQRHAVETLERLGSRVVLEKRAEKPGDCHYRTPSRWYRFCSGHAPETAKREVVRLFGRRYFMGNSSSG